MLLLVTKNRGNHFLKCASDGKKSQVRYAGKRAKLGKGPNFDQRGLLPKVQSGANTGERDLES